MSFIEVSRPFPDNLRELLNPLAFNIQVPSILDGTSRGRVCVDQPFQSSAVVVWDQLAALYFAGELGAQEFIPGMQEWCTREIYPETKKIGIDTLSVYYFPDTWENILPGIFSEFSLTSASRHYYTFQHIPVKPSDLSEEFSLHPVDRAFLSNSRSSNLDWLFGWITSFWHSPEDFLRDGFGFCALDRGEQIVSLCISVFMSGKFAELGTATLEQFRGRDLSTSVVSACIKQCFDRDLEPIWHCWADNFASIAVAQKVGFHLCQRYTIFRMTLF